MTRDERLKRQASERAARNLLRLARDEAMAIDPGAFLAPAPRRGRLGHTRRPEWTVKRGGR